MADETIEAFLDRLAAGTPLPGGGSTTGLGAAMAAALVSMVCGLTIGRAKGPEHEEALVELLQAAEAVRIQALALVDEDIRAYGMVISAYRLSKSSDEERSLRAVRVEEGFKAATVVPLQTVSLALRVLETCVKVAPLANVSTLSDLGVGAMLARAALEGAALNVRTNLRFVRDDAFKAEAARRLQIYVEAAQPLLDEVLHVVEANIIA